MKVKGRYYCDICLGLHPTTGFSMASYETVDKLFEHVKLEHRTAIAMYKRVNEAQQDLARLT